MTVQSDAVLQAVVAYGELAEDQRRMAQAALWANPIICTPIVHELAELEATEAERKAMKSLRAQGMIVVADDPEAKRVELSNRSGYMNRSARRAAKRGRGKGK